VYPVTAGIVVQTKELWDELHACLQELPVRVVLEQSEVGQLNILLEKIDRVRPEVIFLDISSLREPLDQVIRGIRSTSASPLVLALNTGAGTDMILNAMRAGAAEYLYPPFDEPLRAALERIGNERRNATQSIRRGGHTIGFMSAKGGCGATTIACHTAVELPAQSKGKVLLADLDFDAGMIGFLLKTKSQYSISDAVRNTQRLDESYWKALVSNGISGLEIISAPLPTSRLALKPEQVRFVLSFVRTQYDWIVLDLGRSLSHSSTPALEEVDDLFLVTTMEVPALHQTKLIVQKLLETGYGRNRLHLLLNRAPKRFDITLAELETMLGAPVYTSIPSDYMALNECYSEGKLLGRGSALGKHFTRLAMSIAGVSDTKKKYSVFG
jgi:pilus assembly protein CpaE